MRPFSRVRTGHALRPSRAESPIDRTRRESLSRPARGGEPPVWLLDLDNTLHDAMPDVFPRIHRSMIEFVASELSMSLEDADALRTRYWRRYGATLLGMVRHHA